MKMEEVVGHFQYDIVVESDSNKYTVVQDDFNELDSVLYSR